MVKISKPLSSGKVSSYFKEEYTSASQTYYSQEGQRIGQWHGKLAAEIGLAGYVGEIEFQRLAEGQDPRTGAQLIRHRDTIKTKSGEEVGHRAAWDLTFSPPKSVSQTALVGGDERVREAHRKAVQVALNATEEYVQARMGGDHAPQTTGKWVAATFEHDTARPVDGYPAPQLHTHVVVFNMTKAEEKMRSLDPRELFRVQSMSTAIYRAEVARQLRELGYELEHRDGHAFEVKGYTQEYLEADSARSKQIKQRLQELGVTGAEAAERVAHQTRDRKLHLSPQETRVLHRTVAAGFGHQPDQVVAAAKGRSAHREIADDDGNQIAHSAVTFAKHRLIERRAVIDEYEILRDALNYGQGSLRFEDVHRAVRRRVETPGEFIEIDHYRRYAPGRRFTTSQMLRMERESIERVRAGMGIASAIDPRFDDRDVARHAPELNGDQRKLLLSVLQSRDQVLAVQGGAGTGKSTALGAIRELAEQRGYAVQGLAPTSKAAQELEISGISAETLQRYLLRRANSGDQPRLYFLDETSLASTKQVHEFLSKLAERDRVVLVGDTRQHQAVEAGRIFEQLQRAGMQTFRLDRIMRQKDEELKHAVERMAAGQISEGLSVLDQQGRILEFANRSERFRAIALSYVADSRSTLVISPDNESRRELNQAIREELRTARRLGEDRYSARILQPRQDLTGEDRKLAAAYRIGDVIRFHRDNQAAGAARGDYATVTGIERDGNMLTVRFHETGRIASYDPRRAFGVQIYEPGGRPLAVGERIQFTAPWHDQRLANRETGTVTALDANGTVTVQLDRSGRKLSWNLTNMPHIDYAYAMTSHSAQGLTVDRVLIQIDATDSRTRALADKALAYVSLSRARYEAEIFTDNKQQLEKTLNRQAGRPAALSEEQVFEYRRSHQVPERAIA
ncbi:MAG: MobF family relaxase [Candidatus Acidiferrales bacterium]